MQAHARMQAQTDTGPGSRPPWGRGVATAPDRATARVHALAREERTRERHGTASDGPPTPAPGFHFIAALSLPLTKAGASHPLTERGHLGGPGSPGVGVFKPCLSGETLFLPYSWDGGVGTWNLFAPGCQLTPSLFKWLVVVMSHEWVSGSRGQAGLDPGARSRCRSRPGMANPQGAASLGDRADLPPSPGQASECGQAEGAGQPLGVPTPQGALWGS